MSKLAKNSKEITAFSVPTKLIHAMLVDIESAKKSIYLETYIYDKDTLGIIVRDALIKKAKEGVKVNLLLDSWGSSVNENFFSELKAVGGEVRFFRKIIANLKIIYHGHKRNHRKLLIVDDKIVYIGSANISNESIDWREFALRLKNPLAKEFSKIFLDDYKIFNNFFHKIKMRINSIKIKEFEIVRDVPNLLFQNIRKKMLELIKKSKKSIIIETPYFNPDKGLRKALKQAVKRGVDVKIILPEKSDVRISDIIRQEFLGRLFSAGVKIYYFKPKILHAKAALFDDKIFSVGSANFSTRSFLYLYEINLFGKEKITRDLVKTHLQESLDQSIKFNYAEWKKRPWIHKLIEKAILPIRRLF